MLKLGTAKSVISPRTWEKVTMDGMNRLLPTRGVMDDLSVDVFVLQDGKGTVVLCTLDQLFIPEPVFLNIEAITNRCLPNAHLILCATHDHSSTAVPVEPDSAEAISECAAAREIIYEGFSSALEQALKDLAEVELAAKRVSLPTPLGLNRRAKLANGTCVNAWGAGPVIPPGQKWAGKGDDALSVDLMAFRKPGQAQPKAVLSSYASHIHFHEIPCFTGEAAGAARRAMHKRHPGLHLLYALSFAGDVAVLFPHPIPKDDEDSRIAWNQESSLAFGDAFSGALSEYLNDLAYAPVEEFRYRALEVAGPKEGEFLLLQSLRLGPHVLCSIPGEMFISWEKQLRQDLPGQTLLVMAYNRSNLGYVAAPLEFEEGSYETMRGPVDQVGYFSPDAGVKSGTQTGADVIEKARSEIGELFRPSSSLDSR